MNGTVKEPSTARTRYVLTVVVDPQGQQAIGMVKLKGPAHVVGRISFPGGRLELGETLEHAAMRETAEETGVYVAESDWRRVRCEESATGELNVLAAISPLVRQAKQRETEPVLLLNLRGDLKRAQIEPEVYAPDFLSILRDSLNALGLPC